MEVREYIEMDYSYLFDVIAFNILIFDKQYYIFNLCSKG